MRKQECSPPSHFPQKHISQQIPPSSLNNTPEQTSFPPKNLFVDWLKSLSTEERYLAVQVRAPKTISMIRTSYKRFEEEKGGELGKQSGESNQKGKIFLKQTKVLIEGLVFMSGENYLDTIGFDFNLVESPEKIYDLVTYFREEKLKKSEEIPKQKKQKYHNFQSCQTKEEWLIEVVKFMRKSLARLYATRWNPQMLEEEKYRKREYSFYWKNLAQEQKLKILYLGCSDMKQLLLKLIDMDIPLNPALLEAEIEDLMRMEKNEFCNRIFKCKLKKSSQQIFSYYGLIYNKWKECVEKARKKKLKKPSRKKNTKKQQRNKSLGGYSNETNETQYKEEKFDINIQQITMDKLQQDITDCSDWISQNANQFFQTRVLAYKRVQTLLQLYDIPVKLYGSCASGIAIENSDVDIAIDHKILMYYHELPTIRAKLEAALQFLSQLFSQVSWISGIKLISKATVPLIKMIVNTEVPVQEPYLSEECKKVLNKIIKRGGKVCIDLTIETKNEDHSTSHLGIVSTLTINSWLDEIPTLRPVVLILKYLLAKKELNETYANGLNTYCLIVMIVAYLNFAKIREEKNVAIVMSRFLNFFGWEFDEKIQTIDLLKKEVFSEKAEKKQNFAPLQIVDPLCEGRIMTKNCYRFDEIKEMMRDISKKCISRTINEVEEFCSQWNPKEKFLTSDQLYEMVVQKLNDNHFIEELK